MNLVNAGSFNPFGMTAPLMSGEKGARPANSLLVPCLFFPLTLAERASTCHRKAVIASGVTTSRAVASWRLCCPTTGSFPLRKWGVRV
ncbi:hypothetical protein LIER_24147 [Lithospermum erythrorhizon]|uniref:Uncharacterized protein n=1 Tax=Lithospermum erythrorhizon TaxID=34254 RepID=A0AAV3R3S3_LITER